MQNKEIVDIDFDIEAVVDAPAGAANGSHKAGDNPAAMKAFWAVTPILWVVGKFLAQPSSTKQDAPRLADVLVAGRTVRGVRSCKVSGIVVPVIPFDLALATCRNGWGCPACLSAHGTDIGSSGSANTGPNADSLADNLFYYRPKDQRLFTISKTCRTKYVFGTKDKPLDTAKLVITPTKEQVQAFLESLKPAATETPKQKAKA